MECTFSIWKFRLGILVYFQEIPFSRENSRSGRQTLFMYIPSEISGILGEMGNNPNVKPRNYTDLWWTWDFDILVSAWTKVEDTEFNVD